MRSVLDNLAITLEEGELQRAIELLERTRYLRVVAIGGSAFAARHAQHYLQRLGIRFASFSSLGEFDIGLVQYEPGDVVLAVSRSGDNPPVLNVASDAKRKGAKVISITSWGPNPLHELADVSLQTPHSELGLAWNHHILERTGQIAVMNLLFTGLYLRKGGRLTDTEAPSLPETVGL
ncbi:MAG: MurR/RpiR family transcriptional regulator [Coriobacteriia bacterium]|jgi:DNA-binding MurR/RpiR family transcriptional regulator|nr:MurR/RpiR family transcriptional regulator [Coriobacteriia bacterium]